MVSRPLFPRARLSRSAIPGLLIVVLCRPLPGQTPALSAAQRAAVVDTVALRLAERYVDADTGRLIGAVLRSRLRSGAYDRLDNPAQFADRVTTDLRSVNRDLHLSLRHSPSGGQSGGGSAPARQTPAERNFGFGRAEVLDGNVGYLEITQFADGPGVDDAAAEALRFLARTNALIIDVRRNGGGSSRTSHLVFSHFLGAEPVPTIDVKSRGRATPSRSYSTASVPGPRRVDVPLYVLTSQGTASAAEEFSFVLKNRKRAKIVGGRTAGAGHMVAGVPVGHGFTLGVSITRVSDPESGLEWEGVGVTPDIVTTPEQALVAAHVAALREIIAQSTEPARSVVLTRLMEGQAARLNPAPVDSRRLALFVGSYGETVISAVGGELRLARRVGALSEALVPMGGDTFALGATRFRFETSPGGVRLVVEQANGARVTFDRSSR